MKRRDDQHQQGGRARIAYVAIALALVASCGARAELETSYSQDPVVEIEASYLMTCARHRSGHVRCWGGQYGTSNEYEIRSTPQLVPELSDASGVAAGTASCALRANGHVACWGDGSYGGLGDRTLGIRSTPGDVPGLDHVVQLADFKRICALRDDGTVWCWGGAAVGMPASLPDDEQVPAQIPGISNAQEVSVGYYGGCARLASGQVQCWSTDESATAPPRNTAMPPIAGISDAVSIGGDAQLGCVLRADGSVWCMGMATISNCDGDSEGLTSTQPTPVPGVAQAQSLRMSGAHVCVVLEDHSVVCWGSNNRGQLGDGTNVARWSGAPVIGVTNAVAVAVGNQHACALEDNGGVVCWGDDRVGELGDGSRVAFATPSAIEGVPALAAFGSGDDTGFAITTDHALLTWGQPLLTSVQDAFRCRSVDPPIPVTGLSDVLQASTLNDAACAVLTDGRVSCWGNNDSGLLGDGTQTSRSTPGIVAGVSNAVDVSMSYNEACVLRLDGSVNCWGYDGISHPPTPVASLVDVIQINGTRDGICAVRANGTIACHGLNAAGQFGTHSVDALVDFSTTISEIGDAAEFAGGQSFSCVRHTSGTVSCFGANDTGQLGDGSALTPEWSGDPNPHTVVGIADARRLVAGERFACALRTNGRVACWGNNVVGQLGNGTTIDSSTPVDVVGIDDASDLIAISNAVCAIRSGGALWCWGFGGLGLAAQTVTDLQTHSVQVIDP